ncbi:MAG TPA: hypothetical protein VGG99_08745 [Acetobacteraceae bacterium]
MSDYSVNGVVDFAVSNGNGRAAAVRRSASDVGRRRWAATLATSFPMA